MRKIKIIIIGAGSRGSTYAAYAKEHPEQVEIVGLAEPREAFREAMARDFGVPSGNVYRDWRDLARRERFADAAVVATQDAMHLESAVPFLDLGYHMLLEKPLAPTPEACQEIVAAAQRNRVIFAVCHVLRYTDYTRKIKELVDGGEIGEVISLQHLEPVCWWHQAHSFVRGNWRNEKDSSFMLLAKSCHDLDWIRHIMDRPCEQVSSFGNLTHFRPENRPPGAGTRCTACAVERQCPYSAIRIYVDDQYRQGWREWPLNVVTTEVTEEGILQALREGPYGRCAYLCDNDVVDHQVVNLEFVGGRTASFTMTAFAPPINRSTRLFGTHGYIEGDSNIIRVFRYLSGWQEPIDVNQLPGTVNGGHGGGDVRLMEAFVTAVAENNPEHILSGPAESLESHLMVFAAERARREGRVVRLAEFDTPLVRPSAGREKGVARATPSEVTQPDALAMAT